MPTFVIWYFRFPRTDCNMIHLISQKHTKKDLVAYFQQEKNEIMLLSYEKIEEEWFCLIQEANFHVIDKQLLI